MFLHKNRAKKPIWHKKVNFDLHKCKFLCTFAVEMKTKLSILFLLLLAWVNLSAEIITLRSGKVINGQVLIQDEDVIILRDVNGARFQFPMSDVLSIQDVAEQPADETNSPEQQAQQPLAVGGKKATLALELAGGGLSVTSKQMGAYAAADLLIGSRQIKGKPIVLGGSVGYLGAFYQKQAYHFLPICIAVRMPLITGKHAPLIGASAGYGIALSGRYLGGLHMGADIAYRYQINSTNAMTIGLNVRFQQSTLPVTETIDGWQYEHQAGRNMVAFGAKLALLF